MKENKIYCRNYRKKHRAEIAYRKHKARAKRRRISFEFAMYEWIRWWELHFGPNWLDMPRGMPGGHVMGRKGDKGPYHPTNVECITFEQNVLDMMKNFGLQPGKRRQKRSKKSKNSCAM